MSNELREVLDKLAQLEVSVSLSSEKLWGLEQIAAYIDMSERTAARTVMRPSFPRPTNPTNCPNARGKRWFPDEVKEWFRAHRDRTAKAA